MSNYRKLTDTVKHLSDIGKIDHLGRALILAAYEKDINGKDFQENLQSLTQANIHKLNTQLHRPSFSSSYTIKRINFANNLIKPNQQSLYDLIIASFQGYQEVGRVAHEAIRRINNTENLEEILKITFQEYNK